MPAYTAELSGADIGVGAATTFDFTAVGIMGQLLLKNSGPGVVAFNFTNTAPADTTRGAGRVTLQPGDAFNKSGLAFRFVSIRADGAGAGVDICAQPNSGQSTGLS